MLSSFKTTKKENIWCVETESIGKEETGEGLQGQTIIVPDAQETDGDQQPNSEYANNFLFHRQATTQPNQTNRW